MAVQRTKNQYQDKIDLQVGEDLSYTLTVERAAHPTWTFGCEHRPHLASDGGKPKSEYKWYLRYEQLDADEDTYTVSLAFLGPTTYRLLIKKQLLDGSEIVVQDIRYVNDDGTDYYFEALVVTKK